MVVAFISLGCAKNRINTEQMMYLVKKAGHIVTGDSDGADIVVINTCGFIESAKLEAKDIIQEMLFDKKAGKIGKLIVAGCYPERYKGEIAKEFPEVNAFVGTGSFDEIVTVINNIDIAKCAENKEKHQNNNKQTYFSDISSPVSETKRIITSSPHWTYIKIAEGCNNHCSYCCIPFIRGSFRSRSIESIVSEAKNLVNKGYNELNFIAQDLTSYGVDLYEKFSLTRLLQRLDEVEKLKWIRLLYLYPSSIDDRLIDEIAKSDKIVKYLDIPVQHVNDKILKKMRRRYTNVEIKHLIKKLRERIPDVVIRTSVITGLPGEGEKEFNELYEFLSQEKIERVGVFAYSPEEGTDAFLMKRPSLETAIHRAKQVQKLQIQILDDFERSRIGTKSFVIFDGIQQENIAEPMTNTKKHTKSFLLTRSYAEAPEVDGYILVKDELKTVKKYLNDNTAIFPVNITQYSNGTLIGELA